jgi:hypothetical protein
MGMKLLAQEKNKTDKTICCFKLISCNLTSKATMLPSIAVQGIEQPGANPTTSALY